MKHLKNILIFILFFILIKFICKSKQINNIEKYIPNVKKFKATESPTEYSKMIIGNSNGDLSSIGFPKGIIVMWSGSTENIPEGWALCNGENNTPDLRGRFVLGVNPNSKKNTDFIVNEMLSKGGSDRHNHKYWDSVFSEKSYLLRDLIKDPFGSNDNSVGNGSDPDSDNTYGGRFSYTGPGSEQVQKGIDENGRIMPPYFTLAYIMKIV